MHEFRVQVGPAAFRIGSQWKRPLDQLAELYRDYPVPTIPDFMVVYTDASERAPASERPTTACVAGERSS